MMSDGQGPCRAANGFWIALIQMYETARQEGRGPPRPSLCGDGDFVTVAAQKTHKHWGR
jgi:hypothetical protein